jgi:excisionase family DNA binding protein
VNGSALRRPRPPRLSLRIEEAADALGVSVDTFERHISPELRVVYVGRVRLYSVPELERWLDRQGIAQVAETGGGL